MIPDVAMLRARRVCLLSSLAAALAAQNAHDLLAERLPQGARHGARFGDPSQAQAQFDRLFGGDLDQLEAAFREWLAKL